MEEEIVRLRAELDEFMARAAYASFVAETALTTALMNIPDANRRAFLQGQLRALKVSAAQFADAGSMPARLVGLFAAYAAKHGVQDDEG